MLWVLLLFFLNDDRLSFHKFLTVFLFLFLFFLFFVYFVFVDIFVMNNDTPVHTKNESIDRLIDWMIDWIEFYAVSAIFQTCIGGKTESTLHNRLNNNLYLTCTCILYIKDASSSCDINSTFRITVFQYLCIIYHLIWYTYISNVLYRCLKIYKNPCIGHYDTAINHH